MDFVANQKEQNEEMLKAIGVATVEELFDAIPKALFLPKPTIDDGLSEYEGLRLAEFVAAKNSFPKFESYLGAGAYEHHVPAIVSAITSKSEFLTSYTPYQPEASQGMLQAIFEYQSAICALTGMDAANASVYDGASALAESCLMALRTFPDRKKIALSEGVHPHYRKCCEQYLASHAIELEILALDQEGNTLAKTLDDTYAAVVLQSPNFLGLMEDTKTLFNTSAVKILVADLLSYALFANARDLGADIAVGDTQSFGLPLQFGGPYVGYMACRQELIRQLPGRIVGETVDTKGRRGFVLTLQAREQHIRREKATSNICTNQALAALASLVAIAWYGKEGARELALTNYQRAAYLRAKLKEAGFRVSNGEHFNEFAVTFGVPFKRVEEEFLKEGIVPGLHLGRFFPGKQDWFLVAVTETKSVEMLDRFVSVASRLGQ